MKSHAEERRGGWKNPVVVASTILALAALVFLTLITVPRLQSQAPVAQLLTPQWQIDAGGKMAFDVASVKPNKSGGGQQYSNIDLGATQVYAPTGGLLSARNMRLLNYIIFAFKIDSDQLEYLVPRLPKWVLNDRFDIEARAANGNPTKDQMRLMMQALLADRFDLAAHSETQQLPVYALVVLKPGKMGPQLQPDSAPCSSGQQSGLRPPAPTPAAPSASTGLQLPQIPCGSVLGLPASASGRFREGARTVAMKDIAQTLPMLGNLDRPVLDYTGLSGTFDFSLEWSPEMNTPGPLPPNFPPGFAPDASGPMFKEAVEEQLGLKLESSRGAVDVLVIDHVEEPSPN